MKTKRAIMVFSAVMAIILAVFNLRLRRENRSLHRLATVDFLTKVGNRRSLDSALEEEMSRSLRSQRPMVFALIDADKFKDVNSSIGHIGADGVLIFMAETLSKNLRRTDKVFRYGGDEFAVIMPDITADKAKEVLGRISNLISVGTSRFLPEDTGVRLSVSIGIAEFPEEELVFEASQEWSLVVSELINRADIALLGHAKPSGSISIYNNTPHTTQR